VEQSLLLWLIPLFPLVGFLINAIAGAHLTGSPKPVVETDAGPVHAPTTVAADHNLGPSDSPEFDPNHGVAAAGLDDQRHGHGGGDVHLSPGGTKIVGGIASVMILLGFLLSAFFFLALNGMQGEERRIFSTAWEWMATPGGAGVKPLEVSFRLMLDPLTSLMTLIITGVGFLIHLYSTGYMSHDKGYARYLTYLNLFVFFMLLLVMGANLPVMFVGWEGVGLASYLLIGFWYERKAATSAANKAFIINRIGDCALLIAMFLIFRYYGTLDFFRPDGQGFLQVAPPGNYLAADPWLAFVPAALVPLLMFFGAAGKSAQIPLYVWLPDAMEGPTPVSALIHAATMVTGGVYLVARAHSLFLLSPGTMTVVAVIGLVTALLAASIALVQNDIKRVLAYSTVSQLGYMFLACGVGAFGVAMFHVTTHAFFKALLFLGSGSVIHAMGGEQDMRRMGGLGAKIKTTYLTMLIGTLAIAGIPPLAGFWSKDEILLNAFAGREQGGLGHWSLWAVGFIVSGMTAFYMVRMMMKTFAGQPRYTQEVGAHIHESPMSMTLPLWILAGLSIVGGFLNAAVLNLTPFEHFLGRTVEWRGEADALRVQHNTELILLVASAALAVLVSLYAWSRYKNRPNGELSTEAEKQRNRLWRTLYNKWGVDDIYANAFVRPGHDLARWLWRYVDARGIDGAVSGTGRFIAGTAHGIKGWQSGYVRNYAFSMLVGVVLVVIGCLIGLGVVR
jgi:NADH-quinone oxidoreductase subunit L